jgi:hypothetical protein
MSEGRIARAPVMKKTGTVTRVQNQHREKSFCDRGKRAETKLQIQHLCKQVLEEEICSLQQRTKTGYEVRVKWLPGVVRQRDGKQLAEEVRGSTIIVYADSQAEAIKLVRHGFMEWMLNEHTKPYRQMINRLITLFEELQYDKKERTIDALTRLL